MHKERRPRKVLATYVIGTRLMCIAEAVGLTGKGIHPRRGSDRDAPVVSNFVGKVLGTV